MIKVKSEPLLRKVHDIDMNDLADAVNRCGMLAETMRDGTHDTLVSTIENEVTMDQADQLIELNGCGLRPSQLVKELASIMFPSMKHLASQIEMLQVLEKIALEAIELYFTKECYNEDTDKFEFAVLKDAATARKTNLSDSTTKTMERYMAEMQKRMKEMEQALQQHNSAAAASSTTDAAMQL